MALVTKHFENIWLYLYCAYISAWHVKPVKFEDLIDYSTWASLEADRHDYIEAKRQAMAEQSKR